MPLIDALLPEFDREMGLTRRALERVPDGQFDWKPHPTSVTLGRLAEHLTEMPQWATMTMTLSQLEMTTQRPPEYVRPATRAQVLAQFDKYFKEGRGHVRQDRRRFGAVDLEGRRQGISHAEIAVMLNFVRITASSPLTTRCTFGCSSYRPVDLRTVGLEHVGGWGCCRHEFCKFLHVRAEKALRAPAPRSPQPRICPRRLPWPFPSRLRRLFLCGWQRCSRSVWAAQNPQAAAFSPGISGTGEAFWKSVRAQFVMPADLGVLNAANLCPASRPVLEALRRESDSVDRDPSAQNRTRLTGEKEKLRTTLAAFLRVTPEEIVITRNTSEANNMVSSGLDLKAGDEVIVFQDNHPSNLTAWNEKQALRLQVVEKKGQSHPGWRTTWTRTKAITPQTGS